MAKNLKTIANQYAKAIFELSSEQDNLAATRADLNAVQAVLDATPNFIVTVTANDVAAQDRAALLATLTQGGVPAVQNLVQLLARNQRLALLPMVIAAFNEYDNAVHGIVDVTATTAVTLDASRLAKLATVFATKTGAKKVNLTNVVDASILGGVILQSSSTLIDGSLRTKIAKMKAQLLG